MPHEQPTTDETAIQDTAAQQAPVRPPQAPIHEPYERDEEWLQEADELPPPRPRRRLFGAGGNPVALALLGVLLVACGFIGGVLVEKGESSSGSAPGSASGLASRFAALRGGTSSAGAPSSSTTTGGFGGFAGAGGASRPTAGTVAYLAGSTLYVTNVEGNTVKVTTSAATSVTKTVKASVSSIHPGETVTVTGPSGSGGSLSAESVSVGSKAGVGLAALFGASRSSARSGTGNSGTGEPSLFGSGG
jgi:hypothetical protein